MSAAAATDAAPAPKKGNKKLIIIIASVLLLVLGGGAAAFFLLKKPHAEAEEGEEAAAPAPKAEKKVQHSLDPKNAPTFVPLDPFTVNLADRDAERYAQIGITLEVDDPKLPDALKAYMPAIRNNILLLLAQKTAAQLLDREGKEKLAEQIRREASRALGYEIDEEDDEAADEDKPKKKKKKRAQQVLPISAVHFSNFIIQ
ncbi:flagellar basal body-associated FliL family protein [Aquincola tertiaricarbonis]|uniref:flagellar basal body-associated FliL family protein n=1 Tax=Aquincola tertiaricarbonis TaxID=391953 RepID=UPI0006150B4D|nr:flagellar basal body-associated FliL family protein [Aquincola tertiaricarbonis]